MSQAVPRKSDLGIRAISAVVMVAIGAIALYLGGVVLDALFVVVGLAGFYELAGLILKGPGSRAAKLAGLVAGALYIGFAAWLLVRINSPALLLLLIGAVVLVDIGAYFFGRGLGGPKIAPKISPSKTWAGLLGGVVGASLAVFLYFVGSAKNGASPDWLLHIAPLGVMIAVLAQSGDFFESWLKRRAGVKDSSQLIPGHGGILDRIDGMLPVIIVFGSFIVINYPHWLDR